MQEEKSAADAQDAPTLEQFKAAAARASMEAARNRKATNAVREAMSGDTPVEGAPPMARLLNATRGFKARAK
jgi:hypothetical protein